MERSETTELTDFFRYNYENPETNVSYIHFPEKFIFKDKKWQLRQRGTKTIGRIYTIHPNKGEVFYLRMLLADSTINFSGGKKSYKDLRTVNNIEYSTYNDACRALGLIQDDQAWFNVMEDAAHQDLPMQMRSIFIMLICFTDIIDLK